MKKFVVVALLGVALLAAGCKSNNPDQKPVYFVPPDTIAV